MPDAGAVWVDVLPDLKRFGPRLRAELKAHADKGMKVPLGLDDTTARADLAAFRREVTKVGNLTPIVRVSANTRQALSGLVGVEKAADRLDGRVVNVQVRTTGNKPVQPTTGGGGSSPSAPASSGSSSGGGQRSFTDMSPAGEAAVWTLIPPLVPAVGALAGGLGAVASGFTAAGVGAGAFALAAIPAIKDATTATDNLTAEQEIFRDSLGGLTLAWRQFRQETDGSVLVAAAQGVDAAQVGLSKLAPTTQRTAHALADLSDEARTALDGPRWTSFFDFLSRQATPSTLIFGRSLGNLASGVAGFAVSMEPLWNVVGPGLEDMTARFAAWGHDSSNFTSFIEWTIENGPTFVGLFGQIAETAIDVGVALGPLGTVYAEGLTYFAQAISAVAETAPWLIQLAVAAKTAQVALSLFGRVNTGLIQPMRELPGRIQEYATSLGAVNGTAVTAAAGTSRFSGALSGAVGALGGPWGIAIAAGITLLGAFAAAKADAAAKTREYTEAIRSDTGVLGENTRAATANTLEKEGVLALAETLGFSMEKVTSAALGEASALSQVNSQIDEQIAWWEKAYDQGEVTASSRDGSITQLLELRDAINGENEAINESMSSYQRTTEAMGETQAAQEGVNTALMEGTLQATNLKEALDALTGAHVGMTEAESNFQAAVDAATESVSTNGATLDLNTEQGRANDAALRDIRDTTNELTHAVRENDGSVAEQIQTAARGREEFVRVARQMGLTEEAAEDLADEYLGIPSDVESQIRLLATGEWSAPTSAFGGQAAAGSQNAFYATGGHVLGPGTATSDSIPAWLSDGEFVQPTKTVEHYGVGFMEAIRHRQIPKEAIAGFAEGGWATKGKGDTPWDILADHTSTIRPNYNRMVWELIGRIGDTMGEQWASMMSGPAGVVRLAEASIGKYPESGGNNTNDITRWFGMNGAPWCAMFISWLFAQTGASRALGGAARTAWTGDYYGAGMRRTNSPMPGDIAVYGTKHVNLIASEGGGRRIGGNQSNNVTAAPYSGGAIFRPNWGLAGFAAGGHVSVADILAQDQEEDRRAGTHPLLRNVKQIMGLADGGLASGWTVVGEEGPELARFDDPARIYSHQESARMLATAGRVTAADGAATSGQAPLVGSQTFHISSAEHAIREAVQEMTHGLRVARKGGVHADA